MQGPEASIVRILGDGAGRCLRSLLRLAVGGVCYRQPREEQCVRGCRIGREQIFAGCDRLLPFTHGEINQEAQTQQIGIARVGIDRRFDDRNRRPRVSGLREIVHHLGLQRHVGRIERDQRGIGVDRPERVTVVGVGARRVQQREPARRIDLQHLLGDRENRVSGGRIFS